MSKLEYKSKMANKDSVQREWWIVDAEGQTLGRLATKIASTLRGKHKASYTPHVDTGDYVIVLNTDKVHLSGSKWNDKKYVTWSGYPGGQKVKSAQQVNDKKPTALVESAVRGMLPKNRLGRQMFKKMFTYQGTDHPHGAQKPKNLEIK